MAQRSATRTVAAALALAVAELAGSRADAQQLEPVRYVLRIPAPATHYLEVHATYPTSRKRLVELMMAVWTPGSYLVREFARHVEEVRARDPAGRALDLRRRGRTGGGCGRVGPVPSS